MSNKQLTVFYIVILILAFMYLTLLTGSIHGDYSPKCTVTPTPTPQEDNDCLLPGQPDLDHSSDDVICITPTPTPSPIIQHDEHSSSSGGGTPNAPSPTCASQIDSPILQGFKIISPTSIWWAWWASRTANINHQWIEYGYSPTLPFPYNVTVPIESTGFEIGALDKNEKMNFARICVQKGGCVACSNILDPER